LSIDVCEIWSDLCLCPIYISNKPFNIFNGDIDHDDDADDTDHDVADHDVTNHDDTDDDSVKSVDDNDDDVSF
jgi:hypothetical protein